MNSPCFYFRAFLQFDCLLAGGSITVDIHVVGGNGGDGGSDGIYMVR